MQKMSVWEFKNFCDNMSPKPQKYIFYTGNQDRDIEEGTLRIKLRFDEIQINFNPNTIYLKSGRDFLSFETVKYIKYLEKTPIGEVFSIVCGGENFEKSFTIVAK